MEYLYIPTTTLNFNNILSTGSISPAAVYASRGFGYKKFELVEPNPLKNVLLLYDQFPIFAIEDAERDNYPLVLRVRADRIPCDASKPIKKIGEVSIYSCAKTVYFDPSSANLYFSESDAQRVAITKAEPSLTTKLVNLYHPLFRLFSDDNLDTFDWSKRYVDCISDGPNDAIDECCKRDTRINRLKGFACGYILGAYRSIDPKMAVMQSKVRELRNENSAMMGDPSISFSDAQRNEIESAWTTLEQCYAETSIGTKRFDPQCGDSVEISNHLINKVLDHHHKKSTESLVKLVNSYCLNSNFSGQLDEVRFDEALAGAEAIKALIGKEWVGSPSQSYINALMNNIKSGSTFDFNDSPSLALQSFAAFVLKGDDLERLESFLASKGIGDFRIAFALWGAMFGFSKIPKTVFNLPFEHGDGSYANEMHRYVHSVVHGIPLKELESSSLSKKPSNIIPESRANEPIMTILDQLKQALPGCTPWITKLEELLKVKGGLTRGFITLLKNTRVPELGGKLKNGPSKKAVETYFKNVLESSQPKMSRIQGDFQLEPLQTRKFWSDERAWDVIRNAVPIENQQRINDRLTWFQQQWKDPESKYYGWENSEAPNIYKDKTLEQRTNIDAVHAFCRHLGNQIILSHEALENIKRLLTDKYQ